MVRRFYREVAQDDLLGPLFNDVAQVDWNEHLPKLARFWCRTLLGIRGYDGNPFQAHARIHARSPFRPAHFDRWLRLFHETVENGWSGPNAERALTLAHNVARVHREQLLAGPSARLKLVPVPSDPPGPSTASGPSAPAPSTPPAAGAAAGSAVVER